MNLLPTTEQAEITSVIADFLANEVPIRRYQEADKLAAPYPRELWQQFVELGWFGVSSPDAQGGSGLGIAEDILLAREAGRQLVAPSVLATAFSARFAASNNQQALASALIAGEQRVAFTIPTEQNQQLLVDSDAADFLLTVCDGNLQLLPADTASDKEELHGMDESLSLTRAVLSGDALITSPDQGEIMRLAVIICAALTGIAESACQAAVAYANEREQFGQPIGAFQAINHLCADMAVRNESAWCQCVFAALSLQDGKADAAQQVAAATELARSAAIENARGNVQVHGGVGFTVEYDAHLLVKRTHVLSQLLETLIDERQLLLAQ
jgi:alkylation response protein AidB-like acyl-CoA dehydrogenase